jgi:hypothetical protein
MINIFVYNFHYKAKVMSIFTKYLSHKLYFMYQIQKYIPYDVVEFYTL